jgi:hypothetical protein
VEKARHTRIANSLSSFEVIARSFVSTQVIAVQERREGLVFDKRNEGSDVRIDEFGGSK